MKMQHPDFSSQNGDQLLQALQEYCAKMGVSDIHTSPEKEHVRLEIRLHGILQELSSVSHAVYTDYIRRVKFLSKLKLNITNIPQDGQYTFDTADETGRRTINIRVASLPSRFGETFTLRLLDPSRGIKPLPELGFPEEIHNKLGELIKLPNGLILVTGPTGSGKTTTLYALLHTIIGKQRNIITLEDPIEYEINGIVQSEIDVDHDFTFASGLRSILRHDPDVVLVGEIRDRETAQTAIDASLTGHLVLGTLHTNSAVEAVTRLLSMGVSPYTFAPSLRAILAQRLVRTLSDEAKKNKEKCDPSNPDIYTGRRAMPELLIITPSIRELILQQERESTVLDKAKKEGYITMKQWGDTWVKDGITLQEEIERVTM
ncbi:hypothetical protein A3D11_04365 [Candidatus Peribacteria bacterium RIFCSPHIGHO2_02_FULL_49_16]|nr:MAG: hypothetical protein A2880_03930 [Candidatus Peribacteria bacterium RIFCSPHIGHO2_01_FULL_49_38]OGJ58937.1 MAG: hypothetical protein A3D11_04365 [Candidatus Peribacteria bacterium RIFCSPHIGHO2_02_FULL_49_16]